MEVILNLFVKRQVMHENHARGTWRVHVGAPSRMNHKSDTSKVIAS
jgi:hypothetical protein